MWHSAFVSSDDSQGHMQVHEGESTIEAYSNEISRFIIALARLHSTIGEKCYDPLVEAGVAFDLTGTCRNRINVLATWSKDMFSAGTCTDANAAQGRIYLHSVLSRMLSGGFGSEDSSSSISAYVGLIAITPTGWKEPRHLTPVLAKLKYMVRVTALIHSMSLATEAVQ
jgi:hypothetical protein